MGSPAPRPLTAAGFRKGRRPGAWLGQLESVYRSEGVVHRSYSSGLLRQCHAISVDFLEDRVPAAAQQKVTDHLSQGNWIVAHSRLAQNLSPVWVSHYSIQVQTSFFHLCRGANRDLTTSTQLVEKCSLACCGCACGCIIQKREALASGRITRANLDPQRALARCRTHDFRGDHLFHKFGLTQAVQSCRSQDNGIVFSPRELAQPGVHISSQRINDQVGPQG